MRDMIINEFRARIDSSNEYWDGWGDKEKYKKKYPNFDEMSDDELLKDFIKLIFITSQPMM